MDEDQSVSKLTQTVKRAKAKGAKRSKRKSKVNGQVAKTPSVIGRALDYPRHSVKKALRIPKSILDQNAGAACTDAEAAAFSGVGYHGPFKTELSSALKYGYLERPNQGHVVVTDRAKQALRPQDASAETAALRDALLGAPTFSDVYAKYRGENLPDDTFFSNALTVSFKIPMEKHDEFKALFLESLREAALVDESQGKIRVLDVSGSGGGATPPPDTLKKLAKDAQVKDGDTCFVMMPFADPIGGYYKTIYEPAIIKAGLRPIRADDDIFSVGKIIDQITQGIVAARVLVAELTGRNPNVFYELGLAHALKKPVVLVASEEVDVPFDIRHIRVIYYKQSDPFWGDKLIAKIAENILSAIKNPDEAVLKMPPS